MDGATKQRRNINEIGTERIQNQEKMAEIRWTSNEGGLGKCNQHGTY